ncbi:MULTISPECIES: cupredoxin domain-containing protein [Bacillus cereus group]|uniref:cupredoxin domain-containing protein n=1 Tax=Bacillus cereus group TaxID=86661 RepID=UPI000CD9DA2D|nr:MULTISPECIES: cupredoxin domain-containing protein [Bacillus cereus group]MCC2340575.1 cupredoxin domain-containing protein [Bacillus tropicus]MCU5221398.1 cupredoxin domain-containing protein [Bacillus tropicus]MCU5423499.1 cupredoxin domain-containing protein [Bacillus tropicus]MDA1650147.1 cupredoxin domain-containing protein [Bacillus cereus group sp. TH160LC]MDA1801111.1 cupredoxin domain-containing protein [Bacillus cereus group sp. BY6-1LC]
MSISTWLFRFIGFLVILVGVTTLNSLNVFASVNVVTQPVESAKVIEVELNDDYFKPNVITIPIEESTTLLLKNKGKSEHTFTVKKLGIDVVVESGKEKNITVKPKNTGTYELICRYHLLKGMEGKVIVK